MKISPENQTFISQLRFRMAAGHPEPPTLEEMKRAILILRDSRAAAAAANAASGAKKPKKSPPTAEAIGDLLSDLENM
jgi:hypothetical protein